jgi:uncharacterized protein YkwD
MIRRLSFLVVAMALLLGTAPSLAASTRVAERCFPETGFCISGRFLAYWETNGGLPQQGLPITGVIEERSRFDGRIYRVQYFERARFEEHPENQAPYDVLLGLLGVEQFEAKYGVGQPPADGSFGANVECASFVETGKSACGPFLAYWRANGGLAQQGLPISELFTETNPTDGKRYLTQYFERARFEYHPENQPPHNVLLGLLGREQYQGAVPPPTTPGHQPNAHEAGLAELLRNHPQQQRSAFTYNPLLARVARERAADMAARGYFAHTNPDGVGPNALVREAGYVLPAYYGSEPDANNVESIAGGPSTPEAVLDLLLNSAGHRTHILGLHEFYAAQIDYGIGYVAAPGSRYGHYWVILTAQPGP